MEPTKIFPVTNGCAANGGGLWPAPPMKIQEGDNVNAYVRFGAYNKDFYTEAFAKDVKTRQGTDSFETVIRRHSKPNGSKGLARELDDGKAMYLYGGRQALVEAFAAIENRVGNFVLKPASGKQLAVFHGKVNAMGKTKRILMITNTTNPPPADVRDRRLKIDLYGYQTHAPGRSHWGFYNLLDLAGLDKLVRAIPD
jgi:hypothetical protein